MTRGSIESTKERRTLQDVTEDEKREHLHTLSRVIKDRHKLAAIGFATMMVLYMACTFFFTSSSCKLSWSLVDQIVERIRLNALD